MRDEKINSTWLPLYAISPTPASLIIKKICKFSEKRPPHPPGSPRLSFLPRQFVGRGTVASLVLLSGTHLSTACPLPRETIFLSHRGQLLPCSTALLAVVYPPKFTRWRGQPARQNGGCDCYFCCHYYLYFLFTN